MRIPAFDFFLNTILPPKLSIIPVNVTVARRPRTRARPSSRTGTSPIPPAAAALRIPPAAAANPTSIADSTPAALTTIANPTPKSCVQIDDNAESQTTVVPGTQFAQMPPLLGKTSSYESSNKSGSSGSIELLSQNRKNDDDYNTDDEVENVEEQEDNENQQNTGFMNSADYDGDYTANDFSIQNRVMHFLYGDRIDNKRNRQNVKISLLIEAGTSVTEEKTTTS
jgi:hypothetical protein